jgi:DNA repair protein RadA
VAESNTKESSPIAKDNDNVISETSDIINLEIQDIEGIGPTTAKKLKEAGIVSVMDLAVTSADELAVDINASKESAAAFIMAAQKLLRDSHIIEKEFVAADLALEKRRSMLRCSTGSRALDERLSRPIIKFFKIRIHVPV